MVINDKNTYLENDSELIIKELTILNGNHDEEVKNSINMVKTLIEKWIIKDRDPEEIKKVNPIKLEKLLLNLLDEWHITKDQYVEYFLKSWVMQLWKYLVYKNIISELQLNLALKIQKKVKQNEHIWKILRDLIENASENSNEKIEQLNKILVELWKMELSEYVSSIWLLTEVELLECQKEKKLNNNLKLSEIIRKKIDKKYENGRNNWNKELERQEKMKKLALIIMELWKIMIWEYFVLMWYITEIELIRYKAIQEKTWRPLWEIIKWDKWFSTDFMYDRFKEIWIEPKADEIWIYDILEK